MKRLTVEELLAADLDRHLPALKYLAWSDDVRGTHDEIRELKRVISGDFSEETKAYARNLLAEMRQLLIDLGDEPPA